MPFAIDQDLAVKLFGIADELEVNMDCVVYLGVYSAARQGFTITHKDVAYREKKISVGIAVKKLIMQLVL
jgi:hypothetical protein